MDQKVDEDLLWMVDCGDDTQATRSYYEYFRDTVMGQLAGEEKRREEEISVMR